MCDATRAVTISHRANRKRYVKTGTHKQIKKKIECIDMMCVLEMSYCSAAVYLFLHCSFLCLCPFFSNSIIEKNMRRKKQPSVCLCTNSSSMQCPQQQNLIKSHWKQNEDRVIAMRVASLTGMSHTPCCCCCCFVDKQNMLLHAENLSNQIYFSWKNE